MKAWAGPGQMSDEEQAVLPRKEPVQPSSARPLGGQATHTSRAHTSSFSTSQASHLPWMLTVAEVSAGSGHCLRLSCCCTAAFLQTGRLPGLPPRQPPAQLPPKVQRLREITMDWVASSTRFRGHSLATRSPAHVADFQG